MKKSFWNKKEVVKEFAIDTPSIPLSRFLDSLPNHSSKTILDIGCGGGRNTELIFKKDFQVYGCDSSSSMVKQTRDRMNQLSPKNKFNQRIIKASFTKLPYKNNFFDIAVSNGVFHNATSVNMLDDAIKEAYRVLKNKGKIYVNIFYGNKNTTGIQKTKLPQVFMTSSELKMTLLPRKHILLLFEKAGFRLYSNIRVYKKKLNVGVRGIFRAIFIK